MNFAGSPIIQVALIGALVALIMVGAACMVRSTIVRILMTLMAVVLLIPAGYVFLAFHPQLIDGRFRTYKTFYRDIQLGMTREEVFTALDRRYPKSGLRQRPKVMQDDPDYLGFFMNPERSSEPNCEGIFLTFEKGRLTKKDYSPD